MKVHVLVSVDVVERQTACSERRELRLDLVRELPANAGKHQKSDAGAGHVPVELAVFGDELWDLERRQNGMTFDQVQMEPDPKLRQPARAGHCIGRRLATDHQARGRQNPMPMRLFNGLVNGWVETEIVGANDQPPQPAISRLRRN
jgi:hypothetical protein